MAGTRLDEVERQVIQRTLDSYPTVKETARVLGIGLRTLHSKDPLLWTAQPAVLEPPRGIRRFPGASERRKCQNSTSWATSGRFEC